MDLDKEHLFVERNLKGTELEKAGKVEEAVQLYQLNIAEGFDGSHPYDRLRIIYERWATEKEFPQMLERALEVSEIRVRMLPPTHKQDLQVWIGHTNRLKKKMAKLR